VGVAVKHRHNDDDADLDADACDADRLWSNRHGMGGYQNRGNNNSFANTKLTMIPLLVMLI
jgi:hypothetical protein